MPSLRSFGLVALFVGAQVVALALALPFKSAGLSSTSNPNSAVDPLLILIPVIGASVAILFIARLRGGLSALRALILVGISGSLFVTLSTAFSFVTPPPFYFWPAEAAQVGDLALPLAGIVATGLLIALVIEPQWYIVDFAGFVAAGSLIALLGVSFGILPALLLLVALAVYDAIAVYGTKHMISLAEVATDLRLPILMVMPTRGGYDYTRSPGFTAQRVRPVEEREAMFMGLGDVVIPGVMISSAFVWLASAPNVLGVGANLWVAIGTLVGCLAGYAGLMVLVNRGNPQAGLPLLNGGAIAGFLATYVLVFHNLSFGIVNPF